MSFFSRNSDSAFFLLAALLCLFVAAIYGWRWFRKRQRALRLNFKTPKAPASQHRDAVDRYNIMLRLQFMAGIGCVLILLYALRFWNSGEPARIFAVGVLVAGAAISAGFLLGFIFAIPRIGAKATAEVAAVPGAAHASASDTGSNSVIPNSNLVEISDWLTKIIVGVGLVELNTIPAKLGALAYYLGPGLRPVQCDIQSTCIDYIETAKVAGLTIILFYTSVGFLLGYIWTRLYFQRDLEVEKLRRDQIVRIFIKQAESFIDQARLDDALKVLDQALQFEPNDGSALLTKARVVKRQALLLPEDSTKKKELLNLAINLATQSIALMPTDAEPLYNVACYQHLLGVDKAQVLQNLQAAFRIDDKLRATAKTDPDFETLWQDDDFKKLTS